MSDLKKQSSKILSLAGAVCLGGAVFVLESAVLTGILGTLGLFLLLCGGRTAKTRSDIVVNGLLLWLGHVVRFSGAFGTEWLYSIFTGLLELPYCALLSLSLFADRSLQKSGKRMLSTLVFPVVYALGSALVTLLNFGYLFNLMSSLMCIPVVSANLAVFGEYLLTFLLLWILVCLTAVVTEPETGKKIACGAVSLILSAGLIVGGTVLRTRWDEPDYTLKVALATPMQWDFSEETSANYTREKQLERFETAMKQADEQGAGLLVLSEEYFYIREENTEWLLDEISGVVKQYGIPVLAGMGIEPESGLGINQALYVESDGRIVYTYIKNNLVPFTEAGYYVDGEEQPAVVHTTIDGHSLDLAFVICYDINDEMYLKKIPTDTDLLLVPSWDWDTVNLEQQRTAVRASTLGMTVVKHSYDGFSFVSCPNGDVTEKVDYRGTYETVTTVTVPVWER